MTYPTYDKIYLTYELETTLVYVWYISKICLTYEIRVIPGICLVYLRGIFSESPWYMSGIYPTYDFELASGLPAVARRGETPLHPPRSRPPKGLGCSCTRILGVKGVYCSAPKAACNQGNARAAKDAAQCAQHHWHGRLRRFQCRSSSNHRKISRQCTHRTCTVLSQEVNSNS